MLIVIDSFWEVAKKIPLTAFPPVECREEGESRQYITIFSNHLEEECVMISPRLILRMRMERHNSWMEIWFESRTQSNQDFGAWCQEVLSNSRVSNWLNEV